MVVHGVEVQGVDVDARTGCAHFRSELDLIAIKFYCCGRFYACSHCHDELADHPPTVWPRDQFDIKAILCGSCGTELSIREYLKCSFRCPNCTAAFNAGCANHFDRYFAI